MREIDPSQVEETSFTYSLGINSYTKKLLVVLECLKDCAFDSTDCLRSFVIMPLSRSVGQCSQRFVGPALTIGNFCAYFRRM